jgi:hypothetical protein
MKTKGSVIIEVALVVALLGFGGVWFKNQFFHGDTKRAEESVKTTELVNTATDGLLEAEQAKGALAAASVTKIGEVAASSPNSPEKSFITREVPLALASLPAPDPKALLEAEKRRVAVMEGKLAEADRLYAKALGRAEELSLLAAKHKAELDEARAAKDKADAALVKVAAERRAREQQMLVLIVVAAAIAALWLWTKITHFSPWQQAKVVEDLRSRTYADPVEAVDVAASPIQQTITRFNVKLRSIFSR